eukprot:s534_g4.t2
MAAELAEPGNEDGEVHAQAKPKPDVEKVEDNPNSKEDLELVALDVVKEAPKKEEAERELAVVPHKEAASKGANRNSLVPLFVEERGHGKDGELLRDFILRRVHLKEDFRDAALKRWLIREDFFDEFFPEYVKQYGVPGSSHSEAESERLEQLAEECKDILVPSMHSRKKVTDLEAVATSTDVYQLRDTLLVAVKDLTTPRRFLGLASNSLMSDKAKETLALAEQRRLRKVVFQCLKGIWESGVGGEVLKMAMDAVRSRIERFKSKAGESSDVIQAMAGPETLTELCRKYDIERPPDTWHTQLRRSGGVAKFCFGQMRQGKSFPDFDPLLDRSSGCSAALIRHEGRCEVRRFARCYIAVCECLREEEDLRRLVREVAEDSAKSGAFWIEPALSLELYAERLGGLEKTLRMLMAAAENAEDLTGVAIGFIVSAERHLPIARADKLASTVRNLVESGAAKIKGRPAIIGFGLHGAEAGNPPEPWQEAFQSACASGIAALPHAGEFPPSPEPGAGAASVRFCVDVLGARRIAHGVLAADDSTLIAHLAKLNVCLDVCPTSNQLLGTVGGSDLQSPLKQFLEAGVPRPQHSMSPTVAAHSALYARPLRRIAVPKIVSGTADPSWSQAHRAQEVPRFVAKTARAEASRPRRTRNTNTRTQSVARVFKRSGAQQLAMLEVLHRRDVQVRPCTINSDDPLLFGCSLLGEYERCRRELKMSDEELAKCAAASFEHSRAPSALKQKGLEGIEVWLQNKTGLREGTQTARRCTIAESEEESPTFPNYSSREACRASEVTVMLLRIGLRQEWAQLEDLVQTIDEQDQAGGHRGPLGPVEGRRTKVVIDRALDALGGQGTLREVIEWIEKNPKELEELREAKLNRNIRDGRRKPVWHSTVGSTIAAFRKVPRAGPPTRYLSSKAPEPEEPMAIQDAPAAKARSKRVAKKQLAEGGDDSAAQSAPKPKRIRKAKAQAAPAESSEAPTDTVPLRPGQAEDPSA